MQGGISACFPQCGIYGLLEQHGFARNRIWVIDNDPPPLPPNDSLGKSSIDLLLKPVEEDLKCWPYWFEFCLRVSLGSDGNLSLISRIRNVNGKPFTFSVAYNAHFSISDISEVRLEGLDGREKVLEARIAAMEAQLADLRRDSGAPAYQPPFQPHDDHDDADDFAGDN